MNSPTLPKDPSALHPIAAGNTGLGVITFNAELFVAGATCGREVVGSVRGEAEWSFRVNRQLCKAQRRAEREFKREVDRENRAKKKAVDGYNRKANAHNARVIADHKTRVRDHNRRAEAHNKQVIADLNRKLRSASSNIQYTEPERRLADRVHKAVATIDSREYDSFLSYARIDGAPVANELRLNLESLGVAVWFDEVAIVPGRSQSLQMDAGLRKARSGIALLTPAY